MDRDLIEDLADNLDKDLCELSIKSNKNETEFDSYGIKVIDINRSIENVPFFTGNVH